MSPRTPRKRLIVRVPETPEKILIGSFHKGDHLFDWLDEIPPAENLLRKFDLDLKFGPCRGITREDRWKRAEKFGQRPANKFLVLIQGGESNESVLDFHCRGIAKLDKFSG